MTRSPRIAVIGAGVGGLVAAAILSRHFDVRVFESSASPGGKIRQIAFGDAKIDSGPTVFTMKWVFDEVFNDAGSNFDTSVMLNKLNILARHGWNDGTRLDLYADIDESAGAIAAFAGNGEAARYRRFCEKTRRAFRALRDSFLRTSDPSMLSLLMRANPIELLGTEPFATLWSSLGRQFTDPRLRQLFARYSTYCGSSPFKAPATLMLIAHVEQAGVWTLDGGMKALALALKAVAEKNGAEFFFESPVREIKANGGRVTHVIGADGEPIPADIVLFNGDRAALFDGLLGDAVRRPSRPVPTNSRSLSAMTWSMLGVADSFDIAAHNVFFSDDYEAEFDAIFDESRPPRQPTTYIFAPDRAERVVASGEKERLFCLTNASATGDKKSWTEQDVAACFENMQSVLSRCGLSLNSSPEECVATTPTDFARMFPATGGALYGMASHGWRSSFQRPGVKTNIPGLYCVGGSVHPGAGVPMAALSGLAAANEVKKQCVLT